MTHLDIVSYLVANGADIQRGNYNGGTCLINSVQSVPLCLFLLSHGAAVNARDIQNKTALHYAIQVSIHILHFAVNFSDMSDLTLQFFVQEHRLETTKLLLNHGADPHARSRYNDDALQTACLKGALPIFNYLISRISYPPERLADAHDLMGSTFLDEHNDTQVPENWRNVLGNVILILFKSLSGGIKAVGESGNDTETRPTAAEEASVDASPARIRLRKGIPDGTETEKHSFRFRCASNSKSPHLRTGFGPSPQGFSLQTDVPGCCLRGRSAVSEVH